MIGYVKFGSYCTGQAVVQFVRRPSDNREFAVKFYMDESAFRTEAGLYANFVPWLRQSTERMLHALEASGISQSGRASVTIGTANRLLSMLL